MHHIFSPNWRKALGVCSLLLAGFSGTASAEACLKPQVDSTLQYLDFSCVTYNGANYTANLEPASISGVPLAWRLRPESLVPTQCDSSAGGCVSVGSDLRVNIGQLDIAGNPYSVILKPVPNPNDPTGLYWQYIKHYEEAPQDPNAAITVTDQGAGTATEVTKNIAYKVYDIRVSYYDSYANALSRKDAIENNIRNFADGIYEASNGSQRLGKVNIYTDGA